MKKCFATSRGDSRAYSKFLFELAPDTPSTAASAIRGDSIHCVVSRYPVGGRGVGCTQSAASQCARGQEIAYCAVFQPLGLKSGPTAGIDAGHDAGPATTGWGCESMSSRIGPTHLDFAAGSSKLVGKRRGRSAPGASIAGRWGGGRSGADRSEGRPELRPEICARARIRARLVATHRLRTLKLGFPTHQNWPRSEP